jgi:ABC-type polysaccharide/polyol phosphate export permease
MVWPTNKVTFVKYRSFSDLWLGLKNYEAWTQLALNDVRLKFRRSVIGPFWITITMAVMITTMSVVFSVLFKQDIRKTIPFVTVGIIFWGFLTTTINEGAVAFSEAGPFIRNIPAPLSTHLYRVIKRNAIILAFNFVIFLFVWVIFGLNIGIGNLLLFVLGLLIFTVTLAFMVLIVATLSARFRDIPQIITNALQVLFYITPIFWSPEHFSSESRLLKFNPLFYFFDIVRTPLLGHAPSISSYAVCIGLAFVVAVVAVAIYSKAYTKIAYWV